jgi:hypothetical protein
MIFFHQTASGLGIEVERGGAEAQEHLAAILAGVGAQTMEGIFLTTLYAASRMIR